MIQINLFPTYIKVVGYEKNDSKNEKFLSLWDSMTHSISFKAYHYDEENKEMRFPAGINENKLIEEIKMKHSDKIELVDHRKSSTFNLSRRNKSIKLKYNPRDKVQIEAIKFLTFSTFEKKLGQKFLVLKTNEGKTYCAVNMIVSQRRIPIILMDQVNLIEQWRDRIIEYTDTKEDEIFIIQGRSSIDSLLTMEQNELSKYKFFLCIHKTLNSYSGNDLMKINKLFNHLDISLKIFDEAHTNYMSTCMIDLFTDTPSLYLTATPERSNQSENKLYSNIYYNTPTFNSSNSYVKDETTLEKHVNTVIVKFSTNPTQLELADQQSAEVRGKGFNIHFYYSYLLKEEHFEIVSELMKNLYYELITSKGQIKRKTVILVKSINMINALYDYFNDIKLELSGVETNTVSRYYNKLKKSEKENAFDSDIIITTDSSFGKGMDVIDVDAILSFIPTSSKPVTEQIFGRLRYKEGRETIFIDMVDVGFVKLKNQLTNRRNVYKKNAKKILNIELN